MERVILNESENLEINLMFGIDYPTYEERREMDYQEFQANHDFEADRAEAENNKED